MFTVADFGKWHSMGSWPGYPQWGTGNVFGSRDEFLKSFQTPENSKADFLEFGLGKIK
jgi:hypothetical protein